jgi:hypothetical protein
MNNSGRKTARQIQDFIEVEGNIYSGVNNHCLNFPDNHVPTSLVRIKSNLKLVSALNASRN